MGRFAVPRWVKLFPSASVCALSIFSMSLTLGVAESLRILTSARIFGIEPRTAKHSGKNISVSGVASDVTFAAAIQRHNFGLRGPAYPPLADVPTALVSWIPAVSNKEKDEVSKPPALSVVDLGLFDLINPLPENEAKSLDLSWLAHVMKATAEPEALRGTNSSLGLRDTEREAADRAAASFDEYSIDRADIRSRSSPNRDESEEDVPNGPHSALQRGGGEHNDDVKSGNYTDPTSAKQKQRSSSRGSLAEVIEATGDKGLIEEAGLERRNPWQLIDEADEQDRQKREKWMAGSKRKQLPAVGRRGDTSRRARQDAGGSAPAKNAEARRRRAETQKESHVFGGGAIKVDARFVYEGTAGQLNVQYGTDAAKLRRVVLVENTSSERLRVFARTLNATFIPEAPTIPAESGEPQRSNASSFLQSSANFLKQIFLQMGSSVVAPPENSHRNDAHKPVLTSVEDIMEEFRQCREDRPGKSSELLINLEENNIESDAHPADTVLGTAKGAQIIKDLRELMHRLFGQQNQAVQVMKAVGVVIVSFPPGAETGAEVKEVLEFVRQSFEGYMIRWSFSREVSVMSGTFKDSPPTTNPGGVSKSSEDDVGIQNSFLIENLPDDPELQKKLYGMFMTNMSSAWLHGEKGDGVVAAVLDTGVSSHPDLDCSFWQNAQEQQNGRDSDGNGLTDDVRGYNFDKERGEPDDENGHGTHVAGIISACANGVGVVGGSHGSKLISVRFMDKDGAGAVSNSIRAIAYAIEEGAHIINNSWGGPDNDADLERVLRFTEKARGGKGILVVNAAGNESVDNDITPSYPANWKTKNSISVAAVDKDGQLAPFSNWGAKTVDVAAPGVKIYSTAPKHAYQFLSGTSMATPHVSAVAALVFGAFLRNGYHPPTEEVKDIIHLTVKKIPKLQGVVAWEGIPNAKDAVLMARMGGMWTQCACSDMIFDAPPGTARRITLYFSGYKLGTYRAHLTLDVFNEQRVRVDKIRIPFTVVSSRHPADNKHTDAEIQAAYSNVTNISTASTEEESADLCRLQAKFFGAGASLPQWAVILLAVAGATILLAIACVIYLKRRRRRSSHRLPEEEAMWPRKAEKLKENDDTVSSARGSRRSSRSRREEIHGDDVPTELYSHEDAYR